MDTLLFQVRTAIDCPSVDFSGKLLFTSNNLGIHDSSKVNMPTYFPIFPRIKGDVCVNNVTLTMSQSECQVTVQLLFQLKLLAPLDSILHKGGISQWMYYNIKLRASLARFVQNKSRVICCLERCQPEGVEFAIEAWCICFTHNLQFQLHNNRWHQPLLRSCKLHMISLHCSRQCKLRI